MTAGALCLALVLRAGPAGADPQHQRDTAKAQQAQVAGQLDLALASDAKVQSTVAQLDVQRADQVDRLDQAQLSQSVAQANLGHAQQDLDLASSALDLSHRRLVSAAVEDYMSGGNQSVGLNAVLGSSGLDQAVIREEYLRATQASATDSVDAYRAAKRAEAAAAKALAATLTEARARTAAEAAAAARLAQAEASQQAAHAELQRRITELRTESADLASQEKGLEALIAAQDAAAQQALARQAAAAAAAAASSGDASGSSAPSSSGLSASGLIWPIQAVVTSEYGPRWGGFHPGIDIAGPYGTPIHAAKAGVVILAGPDGGYGNFVLIDHGGGLVTGYAHQSQIAVSQGQEVSQGQVIGYEGSTGDSTGPHVHFEVRVDGSTQDPRNYVGGSP